MISNEKDIIVRKETKGSKWATIVSGQPRGNLPKAKEEYDNFISGIGETPDIFCHLWNSEDMLSIWGNGGWLSAARKNDRTPIYSLEDVIKVWDPNAYLEENYKSDEFSIIKDPKFQSGFSMTYGTKMAHRIKSFYEEIVNPEDYYDYVIRWRYDNHLGIEDNKNIDWKHIIEQIDDENVIIVPPGWDWGNYGCCDLFAVGSAKAMRIYSMVNDYFLTLKPLHPNNEGVLKHFLEKTFKLDIKEYPWTCVGIHRSETSC